MVYFVSTPIGNLGDITLRAIEVLKKVDIIACEDTRHSLPLLNKYDVKKQLISYQKFNEAEVSAKILEKLKEGKTVAVISDAGTPVLSDPGGVLIKALIKESEPFTVIPGANALLPALMLSGLNSANFCFLGFLPEKKAECEKLLSAYKFVPASLVFYTAPHDLKKTTEALYNAFGKRKAVAVKEITKMHETRCEFYLGDTPAMDLRGEFVIVVDGYYETESFEGVTALQHVKLYEADGMKKMDAIKRVAKERGVSKSELYKMVIEEND